MRRAWAVAILSAAAVGAGWSQSWGQTATITEDFSLTRPYHPGSGNWATVTGVSGIQWFMYCITRATYQPPNPGDTNFANFYNAGYLMARFEDAVTRVQFKARSYSSSATAQFEVFLNNQSLGVYTISGATGQQVAVDIAQPGTHNLLKIQFLRWSAGVYARANIDDLAITFDTTVHTPATFGWGHVYWVHNGFGEDPRTERWICWATPLSDSASVVLYGQSPSLGLRAENDTGHVVMRDTAARMDTFLSHRVKLTGLAPGTMYYFRCGGDSGVSRVLTFRTETAGSAPYTFAVSADVQGGYGTSTTFDALAQFLLERNVAYWYQLGDLVQNGGHPGEWMAFFESGRSLFDSLPAMVIRGNHDAYNDDNYHYLRNLFPYLNNANRCYAFNYSYVIHVGLDNSTASAATPWFADRLATTSQKWRFAAWHTNPYSTGGHGGDGLDGMLTTYLPVVEQYGVATVFNGHSHAFEVTHPIAHVGNPPTLDHATMVAYNYALASRSQGTVFYNGAGVNGPTSILMTSPQEFTITGDTAGEYHTVTLASVYADSVVYRETVYAPFAGYQRGDVVFTYKIVDETPVAERSVEGRAVASPCVRHSPATGDIMLGRLAAGTLVRLIDMQGRTCAHWTADGGDLHLTTGALPGATYILSVTGAARTSTMKIVAR